MEHAIRTPAPGVITALPVTVGTQVDTGAVLAVVEEEDEEEKHD
jgi:propionyl-CoA carboxylase alpha chain